MSLPTSLHAPESRYRGRTTPPAVPPIEEETPFLPAPPTHSEKYSYFGPQHRWLLFLQAASFIFIAYSILKFATADVRFLLFLVPVTLYGVTLVVSLMSGTRRRRVSRDEHIDRVWSWADNRPPGTTPSVDVFLPTAGEPLDVLANTYQYVAQLRWAGGLTVWVLDDGAREEVRQLAEAHGFEYRTRPDRGHLKKAGNLRFGYEQSHGDLILILDADFVPRDDMLTELAPYFDDPTVAIVQSPQFFDTRVKGMGWLQRCAGATQELFYRFVQPSRDRTRAAICVGTCAVYRRAALQEAGGFAQIGHSEDVHTGVKLMKAGYQVRYVPAVVAKGLCPDELPAFLSQQYRWCTGSMSLLRDKNFHEHSSLTTRQKLCFWAGFLYYISTAVNAVVAPLPALAMLWITPDWVEPANSVWLLGAVALWFVVLPMVMKGRWRFDVLRVQYLYSFAHLAAIVHIITDRTRGWVATGAAGGSGSSSTTPLAVTIMRWTKTYVLAIQALLWTGLYLGVRHYGIDQFWAMVVFGLLGSSIQLPILFLRTGRSLLPRPSLDGIRRAAGGAAAAWRRTTASDRDLTPEAAGPRRWRPDIQGLRAIAVLLVVAYHAHVPKITGGYVGVDVFFVISGFLITSQLVREHDKTGRISLLRFYGGRIRRLLPPALIVIAATLLMSRVWGSIFHVRDVAHDALYGVFYAINFHLAAEGVDYQQADGPASPLQHLWSLAVEEQFYLFWPLMLIGCALAAKWLLHGHKRTTILLVLLVGGGASLAVSALITSSNPPAAYFGVHTRAWELALGALVALGANKLARMPQWLAVAVGWSGLVLVVESAFLYTDSTPFPGTAALLPTLGAAAVIAAGGLKVGLGVEALLGRKTFGGIGRVSYGWYLWHWPLVILVPMAIGSDLPWPYLAEISVLALWFAVLTHYLVENPSLRSRLHPRAWLGAGLVGSGSVSALSIGLVMTLPAFVGSGDAAATVRLGVANTGVVQQALGKALSVTEAPRNLTPSIQHASQDQPVSTKDGCHLDVLAVKQGPCIYGDPHGAHTIALYGDSHAQQWLPALDAEAKRLHWRVEALTKAACSIADWQVYNDQLGRAYNECMTWRQQAADRMVKDKPDMVVVSQSDAVAGDQSSSEWANATARTMAALRARGLPVVYMLDTPMPDQDVPECLAGNLGDVGACTTPLDKSRPWKDRLQAVEKAVKEQSGVTTVDPTDWLCTKGGCPTIVGNILVYRDDSHMTATYAKWLAPMMKPLFRGGAVR
jgi:peptidoglycan/LPS O-acetylase OafA/YrhL/cellulose synthase/poly-beta-1,6-N-acetylglucosamine synthase-like glycosyltransferase